jgi:chorismate dehydratase
MKNRLVLVEECNASQLLKICNHALVIGDEAIKARMVYRVVMDLGEEWYELTGWPMVFGISASLRDRNAEKIDSLLLNSVEWGLKNMDEVVKAAKKRFSMPPEFLEEYFRTLSYKLGTKEKRGLRKFEELCMENELL